MAQPYSRSALLTQRMQNALRYAEMLGDSRAPGLSGSVAMTQSGFQPSYSVLGSTYRPMQSGMFQSTGHAASQERQTLRSSVVSPGVQDRLNQQENEIASFRRELEQLRRSLNQTTRSDTQSAVQTQKQETSIHAPAPPSSIDPLTSSVLKPVQPPVTTGSSLASLASTTTIASAMVPEADYLSLQRTLRAHKQEADRMTVDHEQAMSSVKESLRQAQRETHSLQLECEELRNQIDGLKQTQLRLQSQRDEAMRELNTATDEAQQRANQYNSEINRLRQSCAESTQRADDSTRALSAMKSRLNQAEDELQNVQTMYDRAQRKNAMLEGLEQDVQRLAGALKSARTAQAEAEERAERSESGLRRMQSKLDLLERELSQQQTVQVTANTNELSAQLGATREALEQARSQLAQEKELTRDLETRIKDATQCIDQLRADMQSLRDSKSEMEARFSKEKEQMSRRIEELQKEVSESGKQASSASQSDKRVAELEQTIKDLRARLAKLTEDESELHDEISRLTNRNQKLDQQRQQVEEETFQLKRTCNDYKSQCEAKQKENEELAAQLKLQESETLRLKEQIEFLKSQDKSADIQRSLDQSEAARAEAETTLRTAQTEIAELHDKLVEAQAANAELEATVCELRERLAAMESLPKTPESHPEVMERRPVTLAVSSVSHINTIFQDMPQSSDSQPEDQVNVDERTPGLSPVGADGQPSGHRSPSEESSTVTTTSSPTENSAEDQGDSPRSRTPVAVERVSPPGFKTLPEPRHGQEPDISGLSPSPLPNSRAEMLHIDITSHLLDSSPSIHELSPRSTDFQRPDSPSRSKSPRHNVVEDKIEGAITSMSPVVKDQEQNVGCCADVTTKNGFETGRLLTYTEMTGEPVMDLGISSVQPVIRDQEEIAKEQEIEFHNIQQQSRPEDFLNTSIFAEDDALSWMLGLQGSDADLGPIIADTICEEASLIGLVPEMDIDAYGFDSGRPIAFKLDPRLQAPEHTLSRGDMELRNNANALLSNRQSLRDAIVKRILGPVALLQNGPQPFDHTFHGVPNHSARFEEEVAHNPAINLAFCTVLERLQRVVALSSGSARVFPTSRSNQVQRVALEAAYDSRHSWDDHDEALMQVCGNVAELIMIDLIKQSTQSLIDDGYLISSS